VSLGGTTDRTREAPCGSCGRVTTQRETYTRDVTWWQPVRHDAPCGAPCIGGGVRPKLDREPSVSGIAHAHRANGCGTPGCAGGAP
jgi:hypothetical protein